MKSRAAIAVLVVGFGMAAGDALGQTDLRVRAIVPPAPSSLAMRPAAPALSLAGNDQDGARTVAKPAAAQEKKTSSRSGQTIDQRLRRSRRSAELTRELEDKIIFNFSLGFGLDAGAESDRRRLSGSALVEGEQYEAVRSYGFGDVVIGSRGLGVSSLSTYLASRFRFNQGDAGSYGVPSYYDGEDVRQVIARSAYAEIDDMFSEKLLAPLRVRAGRQFAYGPAIAHFDGITLAYETPLFELKLYTGRRVSNFGFQLGERVADAGTLAGAHARLALAGLLKVPLVLTADVLRFDELSHLDGRLAYQFNRNNSILARARVFDGKVGQQALLLRSRLSRVTTIAAELTRRARNDFIYDLLLTRSLGQDATDSRRYLSFGDVRPRWLFNLRAGTVLLRNIDVLVRSGFAVDATDTNEQRRSTYGVGFGEVGGALEVRLRRSVRLGASLLGRRYRRRDSNTNASINGVPEAVLPDTGSVGEKNFIEGGLSLRYSTGARRFTASSEVYGRHYWVRSPYDRRLESNSDNRSGGRFSVEGWAGSRLRIRAEYDVARVPELISVELRRIQTLRILAEGRF